MVHLLIFRLQEINGMVVRTAAQKDEEIFNPVGDAETQDVLVKFGSFLHIVYCQGNMSQFLRNDAVAAKVLSCRLQSRVQLNRIALWIAQLEQFRYTRLSVCLCLYLYALRVQLRAGFLQRLAAMDLKPDMTQAALC